MNGVKMLRDNRSELVRDDILLAGLSAIQWDTVAGDGDPQIQQRLSMLRREEIEKPVFYLGAGTCGLGAGADKT